MTQTATAQTASEIRTEASAHNARVSADLSHDYNGKTGNWDGRVIDAVVTVELSFAPGDVAAYIEAERTANDLLSHFRMVRPGSVWGTDSGSVGGHAGLTGGYMRLCKSGVEIRLARQFA